MSDDTMLVGDLARPEWQRAHADRRYCAIRLQHSAAAMCRFLLLYPLTASRGTQHRLGGLLLRRQRQHDSASFEPASLDELQLSPSSRFRQHMV